MHPRVKFGVDYLRAFLRLLWHWTVGHPRISRLFSVATIGLIAVWIVDAFAQDYATEQLTRLWIWLPSLWQQRLGVGLAAWLLLVTGLVAAALIIARPPRASVANALAENETLREQLAAQKTQLRSNLWDRHWGVDPPILPRVPDEDALEARREILRLESTVSRLNTAAKVVTTDLFRHFADGEINSASGWAGHFFRDELSEPVHRLMAKLSNLGDEDARQVFLAILTQYLKLRAWIHDAAKIQQRSLGTLEGYETWRERDREFFAAVDALPPSPGLAQIRYEARRAPDGKSFQTLLTRKEIAATTRGSKIEEQFLELFCGPEIQRTNDDQNTWLNSEVYRAGEALASRGLLEVTPVGESSHRFCLTEAVLKMWTAAGRPAHPERTCIVIDLNTVHATLASGGGSGRSN